MDEGGRVEEALRRWFGFRGFRPGQGEVVDAMLAGRDLLVVMPTGGGKSLCYQLPALVSDGVTVVVSPLIALMKDQVDALRAREIPSALVNSTLTRTEQMEALRQVRAGGVKLLYVSPERFRDRGFLAAMQAVKVARLAVDEAHCVSQWGHDFRPDYLRLGEAREKLGSPPVAAFTATATPVVRDDIRAHLRLADPVEVIRGFARPNLSLAVPHVSGRAEKVARLAALVKQWGTGIIYCSTRKAVEQVASDLRARKVRVVEYHAGLEDKQRKRAQEMFVTGERDVAVATNAFGMGIDRADVRFVAHHDMPGSVEAYYQEAGRAGRDGEAGACHLLFNYADKRTQEFFIDGANPGEDLIRRLYQLLRQMAGGEGVAREPLDRLKEMLAVRNGMAVSSAMNWLARSGVVERVDVPGQRVRWTRLVQAHVDPGDLDIDGAALAEKRRRDEARLEKILAYCYAEGCRQGWVLDYFGEAHADACGCCDACLANPAAGVRDGTAEESRRARIILSGVARASWRRGGAFVARFGRKRIIEMLTGSRAADFQRTGLAKLSTYGLLRKDGQAEVARLVRALEKAGLLATVKEGHMPLLGITAKGEEVMRGRDPVRMVWPGVG